jgi:dinuclear metal center YbgI/SA1388 family protein
MAQLAEIISWLDAELRTSEIPDYPGAINGLQLQNNSTVTHVAAAVDASLPVIRKAVAAGADLLVVHHGMFWQGAQPLTGAFYEKIHCAIEHNLAIYSSHLPLDVHPQLGNNAQLAAAIGLKDYQPFLPWKNQPIGLCGSLSIHRDDLRQRLETAVGSPVHLCPGGPEVIETIGLCTGGAGSEVAQARHLDAFITGEGPHWSYPLAEELGVNLFYAGHYATETFGVKALATLISEKFYLATTFLHHPTGL